LKTLKSIIRREGGFTLTELAVAMLVVGILSGIAVPSFLGARNNAYDKEAQAAVDSTLIAAQTHYAQYGDFSDSQDADCISSTQFPADIQKQDPTLDILLASAASTGPRTVSVQAGVTWNSNAESLGCQAFYATALSRSGTCWVARLTVEGVGLTSAAIGATTASPIVIKANANTANASITEFSTLAVNGKAYAAFKPQNSSADQAADDSASLVDAAAACSGLLQGTGVLATATNVVASTEFYSSWRSVVGAAAGANI
jgi:prepilin-type N-terminal cleavage/methylation domain-containing protein